MFKNFFSNAKIIAVIIALVTTAGGDLAATMPVCLDLDKYPCMEDCYKCCGAKLSGDAEACRSKCDRNKMRTNNPKCNKSKADSNEEPVNEESVDEGSVDEEPVDE